MKRTLALMALLVTGCQWGGNLDRAQYDAHQAYYAASEALLTTGAVFGKAADGIAGQKHTIQHQYDSEAWERWVAAHTQNGTIAATPAQLLEAVAALEKRRAVEQKSEKGWGAVSTAWKTTVTEFGKLNTTIRAKDANWQEAKESAAAALNAAIQTMAGIGMGVGVGAIAF